MAKKSRHGSAEGGGGEKNKKEGNIGGSEIEIVFKTNLHCDGCCKKIRKAILRFPGVRTVEFEGECKAKIVAAASVDPSELRTLVEKKINKRVEILSPLPKKEDKKDRGQKSENDKPKEKEALTFLSPLLPHLLMFSRFENLTVAIKFLSCALFKSRAVYVAIN
uniref:HMA domain-containing protein n=1 Tax=Opuntia streptacantha TaxID=393608 RepID=A0A7C9DZH3_OPUST